MIRRLLVPYLMGKRRDGLQRVQLIDAHPWSVLGSPQSTATELVDKDEQMRSMGRVYAVLAEHVAAAVAAGELPVSISGDCVSTMGVMAGLQRAGREPQRMLWLDAHGDFHTWATTHTQYLGGMPLAMLVGRQDRRQNRRDTITALREAIGMRPYPEELVLLSDARDLDPGEDEALAGSAIIRCDLDQVMSNLSPHESLYVHFDTDVLDEAQRMPALKYHVPEGRAWKRWRNCSAACATTLWRQCRYRRGTRNWMPATRPPASASSCWTSCCPGHAARRASATRPIPARRSQPGVPARYRATVRRQRRFVRRGHAGKLRHLAGPRAAIQAFDVALLANFQRALAPGFDEVALGLHGAHAGAVGA